MGQHSLVSFNIPEAEMAEIKGHIQALHTLLLPYLKVLSPEERRELPRMGDMTFGFVQQALNHCKKTRNSPLSSWMSLSLKSIFKVTGKSIPSISYFYKLLTRSRIP